MSKIQLTIEVVRSNIKSLSSLAARSAEEIAHVLRQHYSSVTVTNVDTVDDLNALARRKPDVVFAGIYYVLDHENHDAKVWLADILEQHGIAYTGSGKLANRLSINKHLAKQRLTEMSINTAAFKLMRRDSIDPVEKGALQFPLFVKPSDTSGGKGVDDLSIVHTHELLKKKVSTIFETIQADALVEEYLTGREFTVALIGTGGNNFTAMPLELMTAANESGERIRSRAVRAADDEKLIAVADPIERAIIGNFAIEAFRAIGGAVYGRVDIRYNDHAQPFFLEANHIPSLLEINSSFFAAYNMTFNKNYEAMILAIVQLALNQERTIPRRIVLPNL